MRGRIIITLAAAAGISLSGGAAAQGATVLHVTDGKAKKVRDRFVPPRSATRLPKVPKGTRVVTARRAPMARMSTLSSKERSTYNSVMKEARKTRDSLSGARRAELAAVIATFEGIDSRGELTSSRLNAALMTLRRNTEFWKANNPPAAGTRVTFSGSPILLEYYVGKGLQIQPLGNFGKANAHWSYCSSRGDHTCTSLRSLLDAMIDVGSTRGSFRTWEYFFDFEGGIAPWMSGMAQGTGIQALARAWQLTGDARYRDTARGALPAFETAPPTGIARAATNGTHYLMYSYAPDLFIFNGFLQALIGLDDYRDHTGDTHGTTLFRAGHSHARWLVPYSDTGSWSLYSLNGPQSTREYHVLLRDFLANLCKRIGTDVYCTTADRFTQYLAAA